LGNLSQKDIPLSARVIKISCIVGIVAFLFHAALAPFYDTEGFRFEASIAFVVIAILLFLFLRRQRWSWLVVLIFMPMFVIVNIFFPPTEGYYGSLTLIVQILVFIESLACAVIFIAMLFPATKVWFTGSEVIEITNKDEFHKGEVLEVTYRNDFWDIVWFNFYQTPRARTTQISFVVMMLALAYLIFSALSDAEYSFSDKILTYVIALISIFLGLIVLGFIILSFMYIVRQFDIRAKQDWKLSVSESGITSETPFKYKETKWSGIEKIHQNSKYVMIYLSDRCAYLIPKRNLAGKVDAQNLVDYSHQCLEKSKHVKSLI
jgi:hypothetical protein